MSVRVAVVGAGAAGLCAARHLLSKPGTFCTPVVFESGTSVGGTWVYEELDEPIREKGVEPEGPERPEGHSRYRSHSSMYQNLRTNLPKEVMAFPDFPFELHLNSFLPHHEVLRYLQKYCDHFDVGPHVRFNTAVERVRPVVMETTDGKQRTEWEVTSSERSGSERTERFDAVFVCSGHYSVPHVPEIPGLQHFRGSVLHSHSYRRPEPFSGQTVLVLGARNSGIDICMELSTVAEQVFLSHRTPRLSFPLPPNVSQTESIDRILEDGTVALQDGRVLKADSLLLCTGYIFTFPFLHESDLGIDMQRDFVGPLYRHIMSPGFPSLFFIGLCQQICPFPHFHCQVQFCVAVLEGAVSLPSAPVMQQECRAWLEKRLSRGVQQRHLLRMEHEQWEYCASLSAEAGFKPLTPAIRSLFEEVWRRRREHPLQYRESNYRLTEEHWERAPSAGQRELLQAKEGEEERVI
ncbi:unnamed protein product [Knipowitschia caucasica]|uniref:Flavin-containing monooxygenase n=1 Tax=Knipowitschia caucasica TaxID=637954 RepID=A0AAV2J8L6_KNICA